MRSAIFSLLCVLLCACGGIYDNLCGVSECSGGLTCQDADAVIRNLGTVTGYACLPVTGQAGQRSTVYVVPSACTPNIRVSAEGWISRRGARGLPRWSLNYAK